MSTSNLRHMVIGDATHPDCEICKQVAVGTLTMDHFTTLSMPPAMNRAERRAWRNISRMASRMPPSPGILPHPVNCPCRACEAT